MHVVMYGYYIRIDMLGWIENARAYIAAMLCS